MSARPTVGVLGGLGPAATVDFMARLIAATPAPSDQDHLRLLVDHNPAVPNRHDAIAGRSASVGPALAADPPMPEPSGIPFSMRSARPPLAPDWRRRWAAARAAVFVAGSVGRSPPGSTVTPGVSVTCAVTRSPGPVMQTPSASNPGPRLESVQGPNAVRDEGMGDEG